MNGDLKHRGRLSQLFIYLGKFLRMFVYQSDWKVIPMGAIIAGVVTFVVGQNMFVTQEGTLMGVFALVCVCIWNGFFNSIQVVCRERSIIKREHRAGLHMSAYIGAQMVYQFLLCAGQTVVTLLIFRFAGVKLPDKGIVTMSGLADLGISIFLITYTSDMLALLVSCIVRTTTTAMTVMPFLLIFQMIFSGSFFELNGPAEKLKVITISHWGMDSMCAVGRYNECSNVTLWNTLFKFRNVEFMGEKPLLELMREVERKNAVGDFISWSGTYNRVEDYASTYANVTQCWIWLLALMAFFALVAVIALEFVDRDKR
ncbi:MAG: ABC transporter permease [Oscillospiraceae bacterium]|nr:ABC transporter permease [Oscillospiraceae bacterium]